ncbi:diguanylate cyclase [Bermanella marisrubri]|uniref:diguanylate cyclase n=1 Tax=Bermanella marisrubri TaxID=207949 RepID=Q1N6U5_9GAMM|nr:GGDEF domain-containing protein [Bermanella marisrubri]EAT13497.1 diguanylate cyclase (GGDEF domain) [Oceanobacter sp. RED65] [Bermanella marisrubri]QIZ84299.1 diguanylate cyclase [Bermanella marisrubri]
MIDFLIRSVPLFARIKLVYYLVGIETLALVCYIFFSFHSLQDKLHQYTVASNRSHLSHQLAIKAEQTQRVADSFIENGNQAAADHVAYVLEGMRKIIGEMLQQPNSKADQATITSIERHLLLYVETFDEVQVQRFLQSMLVEEDMANQASKAQYRVRKVLLSSSPVGLAQSEEIELLKILNELVMAEKQAYRYFNQLEAKQYDAALLHLKMAKTILDEGNHQLEAAYIDKLEEDIDRFESVLTEAVQRTRGYLYLLNVVMAAEISEVLYHSHLMVERETANMFVIRNHMKEELSGIIFNTFVFGALFYILVVLVSWAMGRSVIDPIKKLTQSFRQLARGALDTPIPKLESNDEMGDLAQAAEVFKHTNTHTKELLKRYQALSGELEGKVAKRTAELEQKNEELRLLSSTDRLTGVYNRMKLEEQIQHEISRAQRYKLDYSIVMLDVDYFKNVNDSFGHQVGDRVLKMFAVELQNNVRESDVVGRWGGEEFIISCSCTNADNAFSLAEKLREIIEHLDFGSGIACTASFGVSQYQLEDSLESLISRADNALYESKRMGRNKVSVK